MRILFMGTPDFAAVSLNALHKSGFEICGVFTQPDKPVGRKQILEASPVKKLAEELEIPVFQPSKMRDGTALQIIKELKPELIAVVAYGRILPKDILDYPRYGCVNIHGSLLPKYRGAAPIQWAVLNGEKITGVTSMYMAEGLDSGDIIDFRKVEINEGETAGELFERLAPVGGELLCNTLMNIESGKAERKTQDESQVTFAPPLTKELAKLSWDKSPREIVCWINGMNPWPIALGEIAGEMFKIYKATIAAKKSIKEPGTVISAGKNGIEIACNGGSVMIEELQAPGGKRMRAADYIKGHPICL